MHISEGILSGPVLLSGAVVAVAGTLAGLKHLDEERLPQTALLTAAFFVASLIHVPVGPASVHLVLNGLLGLLLGWAAFPAILIALLLQAFLFQFGGLTTLGVNTVIMAAPAVICGLGARPFLNRGPSMRMIGAGACGALSILMAALLAAGSLVLTEGEFLEIAGAFLAAYTPVMVIEAAVTVACVGFIRKVRPEMLPVSALSESGSPSDDPPDSAGTVSALILLPLCAAALLLWPHPASAHKVIVFARVDGDTIRVESRFAGGRKVKSGEIEVIYEDGSPPLTGATDENGLYSFPAPAPQELYIELIAGMGHRGEWTVRPEDFPPPSSSRDSPSGKATAGVSADHQKGARPAAPAGPVTKEKTVPEQISAEPIFRGGLSAEALGQIEILLDRKLAPFHQALADDRNSEPGMREIFSGIGYIFGLAGVWVLASGRRRRATDS